MIGRSLGRYLIEAKLGEGGMGLVFRARDTELERTVAIKILPPDTVADAERNRRFLQEARAASALNHPHIVTIHDIASDGGTQFIVMELVAGTPLERLIPANGLPVKRALAIAIDICGALAAAHEAGIIHRDLKPSNVMIADTDAVKILDFGIAKLLEPASSGPTRTAVLTGEGNAIGTPAYMSPEQAEGRKVDGRSDIFSFGCVLYEIVTGRRAFAGDSHLSVLAKILNDEPTPPSRLAPSIPSELEKTILRCLRKDPGRRYQTMADLKVALEDLHADPTATAVAAPPRSRSARTRRSAWAVAALGAAAAAYFVLQSRRALPPVEPLQAVPLTALSGVGSPSLSPDGTHVVFSWTGPKQDNPDIYVQQIGVASPPLRLTTDPANDYSPSWSPDGRSIGFLRRGPSGTSSEIRIIAPLGGAERKVGDLQPRAAIYRAVSVSWCPDSTCMIATDSPGQGTADALFVISLDTGERRQLTFPQGLVADNDAIVAPRGDAIVFRRDGTPFSGQFHRLALKARMVPDGDPVRLTATLSAGRATFTPDGREIIFGARGALWRVDAVKGGAPTRLPFVGQDGAAPVIARLGDGRQRMVYARRFSDLNVWRVDTTGAGVPAASAPTAVVSSTRADFLAALSPDGQRMAFLSNRTGEQEVWAAARDGSNAVQLTSLGVTPGFPRWSPDGNAIAFHGDPDGRADVLLVASGGGKPKVLTAGSASAAFPSFSRDGKWIYVALVDDSQRELHISKMPSGGGAAVAVTNAQGSIAIESYDGRTLYYLEAADRPSPVWSTPVGGGAATKVVDGVIVGAFDVVERGIYYLDRASGETGVFFSDRTPGATRLRFFDFETGRSTTVADNLGAVGAGLSASRDGRTILFTRVDSSVEELMVVDDFR
jgi:serine/threonine protein kinase